MLPHKIIDVIDFFKRNWFNQADWFGVETTVDQWWLISILSMPYIDAMDQYRSIGVVTI